MRKRFLLFMLAAVVLATVAANCWPFGSTRGAPKASSSLKVSIVARTNENVFLTLKNSGTQTFVIYNLVVLEYLDPAHPEDYYSGGSCRFTNADFVLDSGETIGIMFPAPTNHLNWRAHIGGVGNRQLKLKTALRRLPPVIRGYLLLYPEYGHTDWVAP
jgi:hypothetical protein